MQFAADRKRFVAEGLKSALEILKTGGEVALQTHIKEVVERFYPTKCGFGRTSCRAAEAMQEQTETLTQMAGRFNVGNENRSRPATKVYSMPKSEGLKIYSKDHRQSYKKCMSAKSELKLINNTEWDEF